MTEQNTLASLSVLVQGGKLDPVDLAKETYAAIDAHGDYAIFVELTTERATRDADAASKRLRAGRSLGLLDGLPVAWKDLFDMAGSVTTAGSTVLQTAAPARSDAPVVAGVVRAGFKVLKRSSDRTRSGDAAEGHRGMRLFAPPSRLGHDGAMSRHRISFGLFPGEAGFDS